MEIERIDPDEARRLLESGEGYTYIDVRSAEEFQAGHIPGAVNIPLLLRDPAGVGLIPNPAFLEDVAERFEKDDRIITGCLRGPRSLKAARLLLASGYSRVVDMRGGYDGEMDLAGNITFPGWTRRGLPTTTDD